MNDIVKPTAHGDSAPGSGRPRAAFLLSQLGAFSADVFAELVRPVGLTPASAGVLRVLARSNGLNQRELATRLGSAPSRVVVLVDMLESLGLVSRTRTADDRRHYRVELTEKGRAALSELRTAAEAQERRVLEPLTTPEREQLVTLLGRLADGHALDRTVHIGYAASRRGPRNDGATPGAGAAGRG